MRNKLTFLLALMIIGAAFVGCKEKPVTTPEDLENPQIFMTSPTVLPVGQYNNVSNQDSFQVDIRFEDDLALDRYEIRIFRREDLNFANKTQTDSWSEVFFGDLSGTTDAVNFQVKVVFDPLAGPHEFQVTVIDSVGKATTLSTYLTVSNDLDLNPPMIGMVLPDTNVIDTFLIGTDIPIRANISDNGQIVDVFTRIRDAFTDEVLPNSEVSVDTLFLFAYQLDTFYTIPAGTVPGKYKVEVYANDRVGNFGYNLDTVYVKPN